MERRSVYLNHGMINNKKSGIYCILNILTGKLYIGSAVKLHRRYTDHVYFLNLNKHSGLRLQHAWNKYGTDAFLFLVVEYVDDKNKLIDREQFWMDLTQCYDPKFGYNISPTAGSPLGVKQSEQAKLKKSKALIGIVRSLETRAKIAAANFGPKHSEETKRKIGEAGRGRITSEETKIKISIAGKGRRMSKETIAKMRLAAKKRGNGKKPKSLELKLENEYGRRV